MGVKGKYFIVISKLSGLALDIKGGQAHVGAEVIMWEKHVGDNQCWFQEPITGTIRSKLDHKLCLDIKGADRLCVNRHQPGDANQQWQYDEHRKVFEKRTNHNRVLDIVGNSSDKGAAVCVWDHHGKNNQRWKLDYLPPRYFFIKSELNGKVVDALGGCGESGINVVMYDMQKQGNNDSQLWFEDQYGNIRSKLNDDHVLDASDGVLRVNKFEEGKSRVYWVVHGKKIVNVHNPNEVLDIKDSETCNYATLCPDSYHGGPSQLWQLIYI